MTSVVTYHDFHSPKANYSHGRPRLKWNLGIWNFVSGIEIVYFHSSLVCCEGSAFLYHQIMWLFWVINGTRVLQCLWYSYLYYYSLQVLSITTHINHHLMHVDTPPWKNTDGHYLILLKNHNNLRFSVSSIRVHHPLFLCPNRIVRWRLHEVVSWNKIRE